MGIKEFLVEHWKWVALAVGVLILIAVLSSTLTTLYGAGMGVVAWYAARRRRELGEQHEAAQETLEQVQEDVDSELVRQSKFDTQLKLKTTKVRQAIQESKKLWDTTDVMDRPKLDDD